jgi:hypothetical protein
MLRERHDALPGPSPDAVAEARHRLQAHMRQAPQPRRHRRLVRRALLAGGLAVALTGAAVAVQVVDDDTPVLRATPAAAVVLDRAAAAAERQPDPKPRPDQFVFAESRSVYRDNKQAQHVWERRSWLAVDGARAGWAVTRTDGGPWGGGPLAQPGGGPLGDDSAYARLAKLPRDPDKLLRALAGRPTGRSNDPARDRTPEEQAFTEIQDVLSEALVPPSLRAAMFRTLKRIDGVTVVPDVADAAGRRGIAVAMTIQGLREEIIFDRRSHVVLGRREILADAVTYNRFYKDWRGTPQGTVLATTALLRTAIVDRTEQLP